MWDRDGHHLHAKIYRIYRESVFHTIQAVQEMIECVIGTVPMRGAEDRFIIEFYV